jgi:6-phosphogluconolactonase
MPPSPEVIVAPVDDLAAEFARRAADRARAAVRERGIFTLAIPGGSVARAFLPALGAAPIPWESTALFWTDERAVPPDDPDSNAGTARTLLAAAPAVGRAQWYAIETARDLDACARLYSETLVRVLGEPPVMDLILLGVGEDGHVASLFPGRPTGTAWAAAVHDAPKPPESRVTLTFETLAAARLLCIAALGKGKAEIVATFLSRNARDLPVTNALAAARDAWVFLDPDAASQIST